MKTNITYILSNIDKALAFEWIADHLNKNKFKLNFILLNSGDSDLENYLKKNNIRVDRIDYTGKKDIPKAIYNTYKILKKNKTNVVHAHLFDANIVGLTAAWLARILKRIYTRHHSNFHDVYYPKAVKYDKMVNNLSTGIIAISNVVKNTLIEKEHVSAKKIHLIHHGFQLNKFETVSELSVRQLSRQYNPDNLHPVIGVISRYTEWKGIQYIIPAFSKLLEHYPDALLILANANGDYKKEIKKILQTLPGKNYLEIAFEHDIFALYKLFDVFIHVPIFPEIEAFGQTYVEALASGIPSVFTLSGIANEFIRDNENALVVPYKNNEAIYESILKLIKSEELRKQLIKKGKEDVSRLFPLEIMIKKLETLYNE